MHRNAVGRFLRLIPIVGAIVGFAAVGIGVDAVNWGTVGEIFISWVISPFISGILAFLLFTSVQKLILEKKDPLVRAKRYVPFYMFLAGFTITLVTLFKGLKHVGMDFSTEQSYMAAAVAGVVIALIGKFFISRIEIDPKAEQEFHFATVEKTQLINMSPMRCQPR